MLVIQKADRNYNSFWISFFYTVCHVSVLMKEEMLFELKTFYRSGAPAVANEWEIHLKWKPLSIQTVYDIQDRFEHGSVIYAPRSGLLTTVTTEENVLRVCLAVKNQRKSSRQFASKLDLSQRQCKECYTNRILMFTFYVYNIGYLKMIQIDVFSFVNCCLTNINMILTYSIKLLYVLSRPI